LRVEFLELPDIEPYAPEDTMDIVDLASENADRKDFFNQIIQQTR